jgi:SAM-dependent methyltransferase
MVTVAQQRTQGLNLPIEFRVADAHHLPFEDDSFDAAYSQGMFEVVADPRRALAEAVRVTRPGGRLAVSVIDFDTYIIDAADRDLTRRLLHFLCDYETNGWTGRQFRGLCLDLGLVEVEARPNASRYNDFPMVRDGILLHLAEAATGAGVVSPDEAAAWLADLERRHRAGRFLCALVDFKVTARKPLGT